MPMISRPRPRFARHDEHRPEPASRSTRANMTPSVTSTASPSPRATRRQIESRTPRGRRGGAPPAAARRPRRSSPPGGRYAAAARARGAGHGRRCTKPVRVDVRDPEDEGRDHHQDPMCPGSCGNASHPPRRRRGRRPSRRPASRAVPPLPRGRDGRRSRACDRRSRTCPRARPTRRRPCLEWVGDYLDRSRHCGSGGGAAQGRSSPPRSR